MVALPTSAADRFIKKLVLKPGLVAVVAEGDHEVRSIGSYSVRTYYNKEALPEDDTTFFVAGLVRTRNGAVRSATPLAAPGWPAPILLVIVQSAGTGGYLSADAFAVEPHRVRLVASVAELFPGDNVETEIQRELSRTEN